MTRSFLKNLGRLLFAVLVVALAVRFHEPIQQKWHEITERYGGREASGKGPEEQEKTIEAPKQVSGEKAEGLSYYAYAQLSSEERQVYDQFLNGVEQMESVFSVSAADTAVVDRAYTALLADHPELFWLGGYTVTSYMWGNKVQSLNVEPEYLYTKEDRDERQKQITEAADRILADTVSMYERDANRVRYVYERLIGMLCYDTEAPDNQNICSAFLYGRSVCMGYAKSFQYLMQKLGIECTTISGKAGGETHAWNLIRLEGQYYYVDTTWGDSNFSDPDENRSDINYLFLCMTTEDLEKTHESDMEMPLPDCTATACNYYVQAGLLFDEFSPEVIGRLIREEQEQGESSVTFRFSGEDAYRQAKKYLIEENGVFTFCEGENVSYRDEEQYLVLTIIF